MYFKQHAHNLILSAFSNFILHAYSLWRVSSTERLFSSPFPFVHTSFSSSSSLAHSLQLSLPSTALWVWHNILSRSSPRYISFAFACRCWPLAHYARNVCMCEWWSFVRSMLQIFLLSPGFVDVWLSHPYPTIVVVVIIVHHRCRYHRLSNRHPTVLKLRSHLYRVRVWFLTVDHRLMVAVPQLLLR